jgi:hypothetical protein
MRRIARSRPPSGRGSITSSKGVPLKGRPKASGRARDRPCPAMPAAPPVLTMRFR